MGMQLDPQFVKDLTVLIAASAAAGLAVGALGQPAINGYFVAGSLVGPGGLRLIKEIVQVGPEPAALVASQNSRPAGGSARRPGPWSQNSRGLWPVWP
jgi:hypothetical protein